MNYIIEQQTFLLQTYFKALTVSSYSVARQERFSTVIACKIHHSVTFIVVVYGILFHTDDAPNHIRAMFKPLKC